MSYVTPCRTRSLARVTALRSARLGDLGVALRVDDLGEHQLQSGRYRYRDERSDHPAPGLGLDADTLRTDNDVVLHPGDTAPPYTHGLVERRGARSTTASHG